MMISPEAKSIQLTEETIPSIRNQSFGQHRDVANMRQGDWVVFIPETGWFMVLDEKTYERFLGKKAKTEIETRMQATKEAKKLFKKFPRIISISKPSWQSITVSWENTSFIFTCDDESYGISEDEEFQAWLIEYDLSLREITSILKSIKKFPNEVFSLITRKEALS